MGCEARKSPADAIVFFLDFSLWRTSQDSAFAPQSDFVHNLDYFSSRINGVKVIPTSNPSGEMKRLTVWPHGSFLFLISI